jgi:hypothetical protein
MRFGGEYRFDKLRDDDFELFAADLGVRPTLVQDALRDLVDRAAAAREEAAAQPELAGSRKLVERIGLIWDERAQRVIKML